MPSNSHAKAALTILSVNDANLLADSGPTNVSHSAITATWLIRVSGDSLQKK